VVSVLVEKTLRAARMHRVKRVAVVGGVAANGRLRERLLAEASPRGIEVFLPSLRYCTDNAVMVASAGYSAWRRQGFAQNPLEIDAYSRSR
jgi:N6-L-threonylcarbamoyladenine synthase